MFTCVSGFLSSCPCHPVQSCTPSSPNICTTPLMEALSRLPCLSWRTPHQRYRLAKKKSKHKYSHERSGILLLLICLSVILLPWVIVWQRICSCSWLEDARFVECTILLVGRVYCEMLCCSIYECIFFIFYLSDCSAFSDV